MMDSSNKFLPSRDWKQELQGYCVCFSGCGFPPFGLNPQICLNSPKNLKYKTGCPAYHLKQCLLNKAAPPQNEFVLALLRMGCFTRKQLHTALQDVYKTSYARANLRVADTVWKIRTTGKLKGYSLTIDDRDRYVLIDK